MCRQLCSGLLLTLLLGWQAGAADAKSVDHSGLSVHVFTNLQSGSSLPPFPEGIKLEMICQAAGRSTFWYERRPPNEYPDPDKDKLPTISSSPVPGVTLEQYTIPSLGKEDDGRELWCMMDSSTTKKVVQLDVVGRPSELTISYDKKTDGLELTCSVDSISNHLELGWYWDGQRQKCEVLDGNDVSRAASPPTCNTRVLEDDLLKEPQLACKVLFKDDAAFQTMTKEAQAHFKSLLEEATVALDVVVGESGPCDDNSPVAESDTTKTFTLREPGSNVCRAVSLTEERVTPPASTTTPTVSPTTPALEKKATILTAAPNMERTNQVLIIVLCSVSAAVVLVAGIALVLCKLVKAKTDKAGELVKAKTDETGESSCLT